MENLTTETFKEKIFDYTKGDDWVFNGNKPAILDFYADWCQPCKTIAPILEELSKEYEGKIDIYKINTEQEIELSTVFGIRSIPSLLFIPMNEQPQMAQGALPKEMFEKLIREILKIDQDGTKASD